MRTILEQCRPRECLYGVYGEASRDQWCRKLHSGPGEREVHYLHHQSRTANRSEFGGVPFRYYGHSGRLTEIWNAGCLCLGDFAVGQRPLSRESLTEMVGLTLDDNFRVLWGQECAFLEWGFTVAFLKASPGQQTPNKE